MGVLTASTKVIGGYQRKAKQEETQLLTKTSELAYERLGNMKLIKISNTEQYEKKLYYKTLTEYYDKTRQVSKYTALNFSILEGFGFASLIGLFTYGSYLVTIGVSHPDMVSSAVYAFYVGTGFRGLLNSYTELAKTAGLYDGIRDLVGDLQKDQIYNQSDMITNRKDYAQEFQKMLDGSKNKEYIPINFQNVSAPEITLKNVTFKYDEYGQERSLFQHFNLTIPKGKIIAIVGPSGCGKTSLLNLITRLYKPQEGEILIDGENLNSLDKDWVQQNISYVTQEPIIFQGTILENLEYGNQGFDLSFENIEKACQIANADGFINDLPEKYNTVLFERGSSLSGGQRQRLILARALVKNPKILIMDEGTANLDQESEISIIKDLKEICKNRTCILITHKIENYKQIIDETIQMEKPAHLKALEEENEQKQQQ
ncbi:P-loop containing nucleoside triphosphate hydrolase [Pseudocohnilembus persalinus]|uniref:p-loop containing nucleoside triphosphate hydrolase n=1 Tax=Pseudocohnilembus persalinus TaxID=266149 RepID=A0A0V0R0X8_PSEPJ|nr:P-loop containing nucleoside triphosphate hydrolase [Pseudocohnilembus persalinus]|eukprot:KRX08206.1 P-loop containing nucleoside triphosphate hydrolase [Pseudocohnilembus persalinus]